MNIQRTRYLGLVSISLILGLAPLACGGDDDDDGNNNNGATSGKGGSSTGGKGGTGGKPSGGNQNLGGDDTGVGGDGNGGAGGEGTVQTARLRVVHASPNAPEVDIYAKGATVAAAEGVEYGEATDFIEVPAGELAFDLRAAGEDADSEPALTTEPIELEGGADYTIVAAGDFDNLTDADTGFRLLSLEHDFDAPGAGNSIARIVHATSAWETVDLDVAITPDVDLPGLDRFASESNVVLPAGAALDVAFQTEDAVLSKVSLPKLDAGNELFVIATGNPGFPFRAPANGFALLIVDQDSNVTWVKEQPWVHLVHASDVSTVDVYETGHTAAAAKLTDDLASETLAGFQLAASEEGYTLKAVADDATSGTATALATGPTSTLQEGEHYLAVISSDTINTFHEQFDLTQPTKVVLRGVHASTELTQTVDFGAVVSSMLSSAIIEGVKPTEASAEEGVAINPGNVILGASATGTTALLAQATFSGTAAPKAGERDFVLLVGADGLWRVDTSVAGWAIR